MVMAALVASSEMAPHGLRCGMRSLNCMLSSFDCGQQSQRRHNISSNSAKQHTVFEVCIACSAAMGSAAEAGAA
jgi:hypothetical protein